jgi:hypothetical protein
MQSLSTDQELIKALHLCDPQNRPQLIDCLTESATFDLLQNHITTPNSSWSDASADQVINNDRQYDIYYNHHLHSVVVYNYEVSHFQYHHLKELHTISVRPAYSIDPHNNDLSIDALPGDWSFPSLSPDFTKA